MGDFLVYLCLLGLFVRTKCCENNSHLFWFFFQYRRLYLVIKLSTSGIGVIKYNKYLITVSYKKYSIDIVALRRNHGAYAFLRHISIFMQFGIRWWPIGNAVAKSSLPRKNLNMYQFINRFSDQFISDVLMQRIIFS